MKVFHCGFKESKKDGLDIGVYPIRARVANVADHPHFRPVQRDKGPSKLSTFTA